MTYLIDHFEPHRAVRLSLHIAVQHFDHSIIMKAARYYGKKDIRVENIDSPIPKDNQVLVKVAWCGICGSDLKNYSYGTAKQHTYAWTSRSRH
jgi:hypothetical protein